MNHEEEYNLPGCQRLARTIVIIVLLIVAAIVML
jgi:hypothetical protein